MQDKGRDFPQYRKLSNDKVFYCIVSEREFHEIQIIGNKAQLFKIKAIQYPEILKIMDMIQMNQLGIEVFEEKEYQKLLERYSLIG